MVTQKDITLNKDEYETLLKVIAIAGMVYGVTGDFCDDKYK